jgi:hypothetical protein
MPKAVAVPEPVEGAGLLLFVAARPLWFMDQSVMTELARAADMEVSNTAPVRTTFFILNSLMITMDDALQLLMLMSA